MKKMAMSFLLAASGSEVNPWMILPFGVLLLFIAMGPLFMEKWWHHHYPKLCIGLGLVTASYYLFGLRNGDRLLHVLHEYVSFMALIGSLFVAAGGIHIAVKGESRPAINVVFLFIGAVISNIIGTTGASMLLIRPWVRMNKFRITSFHIVFFIFIVSNVGGCLTPIGDPPLFLGFLKGVPFFWVLANCWLPWLIVVGSLLLVFYVLDRRNIARPPESTVAEMTVSETWRFEGLHNILFIVVILAAVIGGKFLPPLVPDAMMIAAAAASFFTTSRRIHQTNGFNFAPIVEVAWLFAGIFATMVPALDYLEHHAGELGLHSQMQFYWTTGLLSALLDNAPTYLTFLAAAMGDHGLSINEGADVAVFVRDHGDLLVAISLGAVFFGACTYIGNGPNFMVKNIAGQLGVRTPGFFRYLFCYAIPFLVPILALIAVLFFSRWRIF